MDPELVAFLDRRFSEVGRQLGAELGRHFREELDRRFEPLDARFEAIDTRFDAVDRRFDAIEQRFDAVDRRFVEVDGRFGELRRHFGVVAESLMSKIELVAEGVGTVDQKVERLAGEVREDFRRVDRRLLHLTARVTARRPKR